MADICKKGSTSWKFNFSALSKHIHGQFTKRELKAKYYIRYTDDFVILHEDKNYLENLLPRISEFLETKLKLQLHPDKIFIKTIASGVDFLSWVHFPKHRILQTLTRKRMLKKLTENLREESRQSYLGMLSHSNTHELAKRIQELK